MTDESERSAEEQSFTEATGTVRARYDWSSSTPSTAVVETIARVLDRDSTSLEPLYEYLDPDALDALVNSSPASTGDMTVSFSFAGRQITVSNGGDVVVSGDPLES